LNGGKTINLTNKNQKAGTITFDVFTIIELPNFMEYLRSGWAINAAFAIDFTASNGDPWNNGSLHWIDPERKKLNQY
jgi:hypothetical protein